jgi:hypothetical protein
MDGSRDTSFSLHLTIKITRSSVTESLSHSTPPGSNVDQPA